MRSLPLAVLAVLPLAGCDWGFVSPFSDWGNDNSDWWDTGAYYNSDPYLREANGLTEGASVTMQVNGVAFDAQGRTGVAGVGGMACQFRSATGVIDADVSVDDNIVIEDGDEVGGDLTVISLSSSDIQVLGFGDGSSVATFPVRGAIGARFEDDGIVYGTQSGGCHVGWTGSNRDVTVGVECGGFDAAANGTAYIAADGTVKVVTPAGNVTDTGHAAQLVAWDAVHEVIYTALLGGDEVAAVRADGSIQWTVQFDDAEITSLSDMGSRGAALVGLSVEAGGRLVVLDGADGSESASGEATSAPAGTWVSDDGSTIAVRRGDDWSYTTPLIRVE